MLLDITRCHCPVPGQCTRSRAEGDGRSAANQCCDMKADLATIGPEATLKARRCRQTDARSNRSEQARSAAKEPCLGSTNQTRTAGVAPNPVHREFGRTFCRTDRRVPCGLAATPL